MAKARELPLRWVHFARNTARHFLQPLACFGTRSGVLQAVKPRTVQGLSERVLKFA